MKKLRPWLVLALVFVAGAAFGVLATRAVVRHYVRRAVAQPEFVREKIERQLTARLRLDAAQQAKLREILARSHDELRALRQEVQPRYGLIWSNAQSELSAVLTPAQREKWEKLKEETRRHWQGR